MLVLWSAVWLEAGSVTSMAVSRPLLSALVGVSSAQVSKPRLKTLRG